VIVLAAACAVLASGPSAAATACTYPDTYPGDDAARSSIAGWMAGGATAAGLPGELPVMASLVDADLHNLHMADADSVGYFQMRTGIWDNGAYAGYPDHPSIQLQWFIDQAQSVRQKAVAAGDTSFGSDSAKWGQWAADVQRPAEQYRYRYQLRLDDARSLVAAGCTPSEQKPAPAPDPDPAAPPSETPPPQSDPAGGGDQGAQLYPDSVLPVLVAKARAFQNAGRTGALTTTASCANENCLLRAAGTFAIPKRGIFRLSSEPVEVRRGQRFTFKLAIGLRLQRLVARSVARHSCPLAAIRIVAANAGGYRISASRTVRLARGPRACI
jgi:hypothetical protein